MSEDYDTKKKEITLLEVDPFLRELEAMINNHKKWFNQSIDTSLPDVNILACNDSKVYNLPQGVVLILGCKYDEFSSLMNPLIASMAAGNHTIIVPEQSADSEKSRTLKELQRIVESYVNTNKVKFLDLSEKEISDLVSNKQVDFVFDSRWEQPENFETLTLESGVEYASKKKGLNLSIIEKNADVKVAARQLSEYKFYKSGQDSRNIDLVYVDRKIYGQLIAELKVNLLYLRSDKGHIIFLHGHFKNSEEYDKVISRYEELKEKYHIETIFNSDASKLACTPILYNFEKGSLGDIQPGDNFGPILAIKPFDELKEVLEEIEDRKDIGDVFFFGETREIFEDLKSLIPSKQLFFNSLLQTHRSGILPDLESVSGYPGITKGLMGYQTFSKPKVFISHSLGKYSISQNKFKSLKVPNKWLNKLATRHVVKGGGLLVALALLKL